MTKDNVSVESIEEIKQNIFILKVKAPQIAVNAKPGQFCNIKVSDTVTPLLRRPLSICDVEGDIVSFQFALVGEGTKILSEKEKGDILNIVGPLGNGFNLTGEYKNALIIAGGIGAAPFPLVIKNIPNDKTITSFVGGRTKSDIVEYKLKNIITATDDGSEGFHGNVVQLLNSEIDKYSNRDTKIFACGPTPMLRALSEYSIERGFDCQISTESVMACGFGICQGCNIESAHSDKFLLVCKDGPVFNAEDVKL
jgi:dihydroorotate dehydrogenase electron transfer subunit